MNQLVPLSRCRYGEHLSREQVAELVAPHPETLDLVNSWLRDYDIPISSVSTTLNGNWLMVTDIPVPQVNDILGASYQLYRNVETNDKILRTLSYSLPEVLHDHIQTVVPTTYFGPSRSRSTKSRIHTSRVAMERTNARSEESVAVLPIPKVPVTVTPAFVRSLYKTMGYVPTSVDRNSLAIAGYIEQYPSPQDLNAFMKEFRSDGEGATFTVERVNGGEYDPSNPGREGNADIQYAEAMTYPTPIVYYSTGGEAGTPTDPYLHWLVYMFDQKSVPQTISTSYHSNETDVPLDYAKAICELFARLGARGVSLLFSTGNDGVGHGNCLVESGPQKSEVRFLPQFPASCMYGVLLPCSKAVHRCRYKLLTTPRRFRRSMGH
jgi:tripeptidyl-peptidase-1